MNEQFLSRRASQSKHIEYLDVHASEMSSIPLLGSITAGQPIDVFSETGQSIDVPAKMIRKNCYALRVKGDSMIDDAIEDGDIIVVQQQQTAENGQSVVAMIAGEQVTLKRFYIENDGIRLQPANPNRSALYFEHDQVDILGVVMGVIRQRG